MNRFTVLASLTLLALAGCGDDSKSASTTPPATDAGVEETVAPDTAATVAAGAGSEFCDINQELNDTPSPIDNEAATAADFEEYFTAYFPEALARATAAAPPAVADDVATLVAGMEELIGVLSANGWDMKTALADPALTPLLSSDDFNAAGDRVDAFCGT